MSAVAGAEVAHQQRGGSTKYCKTTNANSQLNFASTSARVSGAS